MFDLVERIGDVKSTGIDTSEILDNLILPYELRIRGRLRATTETKVDVGLFLDRGPVLRDGDLLQARTGEIVRIRAAEEQVVTARIKSGQPLARLCYHLGNRHVTLAIGEDEQGSFVRFPPDHVLEELAERLGAVKDKSAPSVDGHDVVYRHPAPDALASSQIGDAIEMEISHYADPMFKPKGYALD